MSRTGTIAWREFSTTVRRASYILATLGTPVFFLFVAGITAVPSLVAVRREIAERRNVAVVDEAGLLTAQSLATLKGGGTDSGGLIEELFSQLSDPSGPERPRHALRYKSREAAEADLRDGKLLSFYVVPSDYVKSGRIEYVTRRRGVLWSPSGRANPLRAWLVEGLLFGKVDAERAARARSPIADVQTFVLRPSGQLIEQTPQEVLARVVLPFAFAFILMLSIFIASGYLIQGLVEEKSSRVIELLLSSVTPGELITGKLIGLGCAGLLQLVVWVGVSLAPVLLVGKMEVAPAVVVLSAAYYLVGFVFFGSIMAGLGCVAGGTHESQQFASLWSVVAVVPMLFSPLILESPNSVFSRVLSYVPFTSPITMIMRCASGEYIWWDVPLSLAVMLAAIYLSLRLSGRLFRVGLLMHGQRLSVRETLASLRS